MGIKQVAKAIKDKENKYFLVSTHQNMEGDAIGSMLAFSELLKAAGKKVVLFPPEDIPDLYRFLPDQRMVRKKSYLRPLKYDIACLVDCTDLNRLGKAKKGIRVDKPIINIDHHISNTHFGSINWVESKMSCSGEQIYWLFKEMSLPLNKKAALYIYIAIVTDTGSFRYSNTNARTHEIAAELVSHGIDPTDVYRRIYEGTKKSRLRLLSDSLATINTSKDGKIAWIRVTNKMLRRHSAHIDDTQDFINFPRAIKGVKIAIAFKEIRKNLVKVTLRSNDGLDVNRLARFFKGGGHISASGCVLAAPIAKAERAVIIKAKELLKV